MGSSLPWYGQRSPLRRSKVLREEDDLAYVVRMMGELPVERLHHRMPLAANEHVAQQVVTRQGSQRGEEYPPPALPVVQHGPTGHLPALLEFPVPVAIRLLPVGGQEVSEA